MTRSQAREQAFILVFEKMFSPELTFEDMKELVDESGLFELDKFAEQLYLAVDEHTGEADTLISTYAKSWKIERLPKVCVAVLRLAVTEIVYFENIPDSVSANEAVELTKKYASNEDASFVNGLLGSVIRGKTN